MNCQEAKDLWSPYHDGELDRTFCGEIERHLEACPECRRFFAAQGQFHGALTQAVRQGQSTATLWEREEAAIRAAFGRQTAKRESCPLTPALPINRVAADASRLTLKESQSRLTSAVTVPGAGDLSARANGLAWLWPSPKFCGALAVVWVLLLAVNRWADSGDSGAVSRYASTPAHLAALAEQRRELRALLMATDQERTRPAAHPLGPRSERKLEREILPVGWLGREEGTNEIQLELA